MQAMYSVDNGAPSTGCHTIVTAAFGSSSSINNACNADCDWLALLTRFAVPTASSNRDTNHYSYFLTVLEYHRTTSSTVNAIIVNQPLDIPILHRATQLLAVPPTRCASAAWLVVTTHGVLQCEVISHRQLMQSQLCTWPIEHDASQPQPRSVNASFDAEHRLLLVQVDNSIYQLSLLQPHATSASPSSAPLQAIDIALCASSMPHRALHSWLGGRGTGRSNSSMVVLVGAEYLWLLHAQVQPDHHVRIVEYKRTSLRNSASLTSAVLLSGTASIPNTIEPPPLPPPVLPSLDDMNLLASRGASLFKLCKPSNLQNIISLEQDMSTANGVWTLKRQASYV
jgi:hypothetical protein